MSDSNIGNTSDINVAQIDSSDRLAGTAATSSERMPISEEEHVINSTEYSSRHDDVPNDFQNDKTNIITSNVTISVAESASPEGDSFVDANNVSVPNSIPNSTATGSGRSSSNSSPSNSRHQLNSPGLLRIINYHMLFLFARQAEVEEEEEDRIEIIRMISAIRVAPLVTLGNLIWTKVLVPVLIV